MGRKLICLDGRRRRRAIILAGIAILTTATFSRLSPAALSYLPPCPWRALTGLFCPGCGSVRSLHCMMHGRLIEAFGLNPLSVALLPFLLYMLFSRLTNAVGGCPLPRPFIPASCIYIFFWVVIAFWVLRNIPVPPFLYLAP